MFGACYDPEKQIERKDILKINYMRACHAL